MRRGIIKKKKRENWRRRAFATKKYPCSSRKGSERNSRKEEKSPSLTCTEVLIAFSSIEKRERGTLSSVLWERGKGQAQRNN